jgi:hypothetical protein
MATSRCSGMMPGSVIFSVLIRPAIIAVRSLIAARICSSVST